jgi:hypothetical protein
MPFPEFDGSNSRSKNVKSRGEVDEDDSDESEDWDDDGERKSEELDWNNNSFNNNEKYAVRQIIHRGTQIIFRERIFFSLFYYASLHIYYATQRNANAGQQKLGKSKSWDRPYVSNYKPNERFMISVTKKEETDGDDLGIDLVEFQESEIYVSEVNPGPFYETGMFYQFLL